MGTDVAPGLSGYWSGIITVLIVIAVYLFIRSQQGKR